MDMVAKERFIVSSFVLLAVLFGLAGCSTPIPIDSTPTGADITTPWGASFGTTPSRLNPGSYELKKSGYVTKPVQVPRGFSGTLQIELEKEILKVTLSSKPAGADVHDSAGNLVGQTPLTLAVPSSQTYEVRKFGYSNKSITLSESSSTQIDVDLGEPISGMMLMKIVVGDNGLEVRSSMVYSERDVIERSPTVKAVRRLTDFPASRWVGRFSPFPDGRKLLMDVLDKDNLTIGEAPFFSNLWAMDVGGSGGLQRWTEGKYLDEGPCFSEDGNHVYFGSSRAGKNAIFRMSVTNLKGLGMVTPGTTADSYPQVSPNGETLMWTASMSGSDIPQLWSMPLSKGLPSGLPMQIREGSEPRWSPKGDLILFTSLDRNINKTKIWTMAPDGSRPTQLTTASSCNDTDPRWSPDGSQIIFASDRGVSNGKQNFDIWIMNSDGSNPKQLTTNGSLDDRPVFSPDGRVIYFRSNRGLKWDIWVMQLAEGDASK